MTKRFQNRVAQSRWALTFVGAYALLVCVAAGFVMSKLWVSLAFLVVTNMMMVVLNNSNALIRIYSRMVSCSFLVMATAAVFLFQQWQMSLIEFATAACYLSLFRAYQDPQASGSVFYAFAAIGLASTVWVHALLLVPVLWIVLGNNILAFSGRTFVASILGLLVPYWFLGAWMLFTGNVHFLNDHFSPLLTVVNPFVSYPADIPHLLTAAFVLLLALVGGIHFILYSYLDKIRTRMLYEALITIDAFLFVCMMLQPQHLDALLAMAIVTTAPLAGHFIALSSTKLSNIFFHIIIIASLVLTAHNLWIYSSVRF